MPFKKGQSGNPGGRVRDRAFTDMLRVALNEKDSKGVKKLRVIADKLVASAMAGNPFAVQQIADRLEGKPTQPTAGDNSLPPVRITRIELVAADGNGSD
jgi:Family of unknown function (DUF5681)